MRGIRQRFFRKRGVQLNNKGKKRKQKRRLRPRSLTRRKKSYAGVSKNMLLRKKRRVENKERGHVKEQIEVAPLVNVGWELNRGKE